MINPLFYNEIVIRFFDQYFNPLLLHDLSVLPIILVIEEADIKQSRYYFIIELWIDHIIDDSIDVGFYQYL